ncbi:right-handed parallel beta-helix repeat-containing protein [Sphingobacterium sp.]|uniref:right-handed parallel beta-helix repeat-containing protein n=1 Tax=Sphingobacterium sp. TaxID=341027 RepID=UPI00289D7FA9|nr:right-handed parallel beta-helix repeat-containing protein [Sphingobacterium sp.]
MIRYLFTSILIFLLTTAKADIVLFVSPTGNDQNSGTLEQPLHSLDYALAKAKEMKQKQPKEAVKIYLRAGEYAFNKAARVDRALSGTAGQPTIIAAYQNEEVVFTGAIKINGSDFAPVKDRKERSFLHKDAANKILVADVNASGIAVDEGLFPHGFGYSIEELVPSSSMLFIDNEAYDLGRWPNAGEPIVKIAEVLNKGSIARYGKVDNPYGAQFKYIGDVKNWKQKDNIWIYGYFAYGYADDNVMIQAIDTKKKTISTTHPHIYGFHSSADTSDWGLKHSHKIRGFHFYNILEEVDQPGEYYFDRDANRLFIYPSSSIASGTDVRLTQFAEPFLIVEGVNYLNIENIDFKYARGLGIYLGYVSHVTIRDCRFENLGGRAISMGDTYPTDLKTEIDNQNQNSFVRIENCYINNMGSGGIYINGGDNRTLTPGNNLVQNCEISNFNLFNKTYAPAVRVTGVGHTVRHCYVHSAPHMAIGFQGNNLLFEYNKIANVCQNASDMGAMYTGRNQAEQNNTIRYNYFENVYKDDENRVCAVYLDDGTVGHYVYGNIFNRCGNPTDKGSFGAVHVNGGYNNYFTNNIFINCKQALGNSPWTIEKWKTDLMAADLQNKLTERVDIRSNVYKDAYPQLHTILDTAVVPMRYNFSDNNIAFLCGNFASGNYVNSNMLFLKDSEKSDPFVDYKNKNFNLKDSIRIKEVLPKFQAIPYDRIGLIE